MSLDVFQQVFALSLSSALVNNYTGTQSSLQKALQEVLTEYALPAIGPEWQLVWGPVVWKKNPDDEDTGPDNAWYIAFHPDLVFEDGSVHPTYVVSISGTPPKSWYTWLRENFAVGSVVDFSAWVASGIQNPPVITPPGSVVPGGAYLSIGSATGIHIHLTVPAPEGSPSAGTTLLDFFASLDITPDTRFITTGHSLGGALSPSIALALVKTGLIPVDRTLVYPSAGASPGDPGFTNLFIQAFPGRPSQTSESYKGWNLNLVNTLDIVPQAWCVDETISPQQNLVNISSIYGLPPVPLVEGITRLFAKAANGSGVVYLPLPSQYFTGPPPTEVPQDVRQFLNTATPQHVKYYIEEVGIPIPTLREPLEPKYGLHRKSADEEHFGFPYLADLEWAAEHPDEARKEVEREVGW